MKWNFVALWNYCKDWKCLVEP